MYQTSTHVYQAATYVYQTTTHVYQTVRKISSLKLQEAHTTQSLGLEMGGSCSSELDDLKKQNQQLKNRVTLYENGITDASLHASQNNIGLLNISNESNSECNCSSKSWLSVIEIVGIMIVVLVTIYILYGWLCRYLMYRKGEKDKRRAKFMMEMQKRLGKTKDDTTLEIAHCDKVHVPDFHEATFQH